MPFPFTLPTTSHLNFQAHLSCSTHPSLTSAATSHRTVLRSALKGHKRLHESAQVHNIQNILSAIIKYLPYLLTIDAALSGKPVNGEYIDLALAKEIEVEWRPTLSAINFSGRDTTRVKGRGLDYEVFFLLQTLATVQILLARQVLLGLYSATNPTTDQRLSYTQTATRSVAFAQNVHNYLVHRSSSAPDGPPSLPSAALDVSNIVQQALLKISEAEVTLLFVLKDDSYASIIMQSRNKNDKEWMIKAPEIKRARATIIARLCLAAAENAAVASALLRSDGSRVSKGLVSYCEDLQSTSRAKACRFFAIDADLAGETGKGIAWLRGGMSELGLAASAWDSKLTGLAKLKNTWNERKEDKKVEKGTGKWGSDAGKSEEARILEWLDRKWTKMNDTINVQIVPDFQPLLVAMPSSRDLPISKEWTPELLGEEELSKMRTPAEMVDQEGVSSGDEDDANNRPGDPVGAFPGTKNKYKLGSQEPTYY